MAAFSIGAGLIVMAGALAITRQQRLYQSVILKALGATRGFVSRVFAVEYALLGAAAGLAGSALAAILAWAVLRLALEVPGAGPPARCSPAWSPPPCSRCWWAFSAPGACSPPAARRAPKRVTLLERLRALYPEASGRSLKQWLEAGRVEVNGRPAKDGRLTLTAADAVALAARRAVPFPRGLSLVHEDETILVVVKPSGLLSIATDRERDRTAYRLLWDYLAAKRQRPFIVHRLDRETSACSSSPSPRR